MIPPADTEHYNNHCFPGEIISHGVCLYYPFPLSYPTYKRCCSNAVSTSPMKPSANGVLGS
jgi:hypothetical protein